MMIHERHDRFFVAGLDNLEERRQVERDTGTDPGPIHGFIEVKLVEGSPAAWAASVLRELADQLEREG
jgi:hypothetical protein